MEKKNQLLLRIMMKNAGIYFDEFNSALAASSGGSLQFYNKSKLVPGVETLPDFLRWMSPVF